MIFNCLGRRSFHCKSRQSTPMSASLHSLRGTLTMYRQPPSPLSVKTRSSSRGDDSSITAAIFGTRSGIDNLALASDSCKPIRIPQERQP